MWMLWTRVSVIAWWINEYLQCERICMPIFKIQDARFKLYASFICGISKVFGKLTSSSRLLWQHTSSWICEMILLWYLLLYILWLHTWILHCIFLLFYVFFVLPWISDKLHCEVHHLSLIRPGSGWVYQNFTETCEHICLYLACLACSCRFFSRGVLQNPSFVLIIEPLQDISHGLKYAYGAIYNRSIAICMSLDHSKAVLNCMYNRQVSMEDFFVAVGTQHRS